MNNVIIRPSLPEDVEQVVPLIYSSGPDAFDYVFKSKKSSTIDFLKFAFTRSGGEFGYQNHVTVLLDNTIIGVGAAFTGTEMFRYTLAAARKILMFYKWDAFRIIINGLTIESLIKPPRKDEVAIGHLGIHKSAQGLGIGTKLIDHLMKHPKIKNETFYVLDVSTKYPRAQKLYENLGFEISKTCRSKLSNNYAHVVDHFRMQMRIN